MSTAPVLLCQASCKQPSGQCSDMPPALMLLCKASCKQPSCQCLKTIGFCILHRYVAAELKPATRFKPTAPVLLCEASCKRPSCQCNDTCRFLLSGIALLHLSIESQHYSLGPCSCPLHQCCSVQQAAINLLVSAVTCPLHRCCSAKQAANSLLVNAVKNYRFLYIIQVGCSWTEACD